MDTATTNQAEVVIARASLRRALGAILWPMVIAATAAGLIALLPSRSGEEGFDSRWFLIGLLLTGAAALCGAYLLPHRLVVRSGQLQLHSRTGGTQSIELHNIQEVHVRQAILRRNALVFRGVGVVLTVPEVRYNGKPVRAVLKMNRSLFGCHWFTCRLFQQSPERIAECIALVVRDRCGHSPTIRFISPLIDIAYHMPETACLEHADGTGYMHALAHGDAVGIRCIGCSYDLRGRLPMQSCPECGTPVQRSLEGPCLAVADSLWLKRLQLACYVLLASVLPWLMAGVLARGVFKNLRGGAPSLLGNLVLEMTALALAEVALLALISGAWLLTRPEPGLAEITRDPWSRRLTRWACILPCLGAIMMPLAVPTPIAVLTWPWTVLPAIAFLLWYCSKLLGRVPAEIWRILTVIVTVFLACCAVIYTVRFSPMWLGGMGRILGSLQYGGATPASTPPDPSQIREQAILASIVIALPALLALLVFATLSVHLRKTRSKGQMESG